MSWGNKSLEVRLELLIRLPLPSVREVAKSCHGRMGAKTSSRSARALGSARAESATWIARSARSSPTGE
jgi:hypothetical protein